MCFLTIYCHCPPHFTISVAKNERFAILFLGKFEKSDFIKPEILQAIYNAYDLEDIVSLCLTPAAAHAVAGVYFCLPEE